MLCGDINGKEIQKRGDIYVNMSLIHFFFESKITLIYPESLLNTTLGVSKNIQTPLSRVGFGDCGHTSGFRLQVPGKHCVPTTQGMWLSL